MSEKFNSIEEILEFAINKEYEARDFYKEWAGKVKNETLKEVLISFTGEEQKHADMIIDVKNGGKFKPVERKITDMKIAEYIVDVEPSEDMDYQEALILAMKREKAAFKLYSDLAESSSDENIKNLFNALAQEEAKHKLRLETIYDEVAYPEN